MEQRKLIELKQRAKTAFGLKHKNIISKQNLMRNDVMLNIKNKSKLNTNVDTVQPILPSSAKTKTNYNINNSKSLSSNQSLNAFPKKYHENNFNNYNEIEKIQNSNNIININKKLINDLNEQINILNEMKNANKYNYKQTVNLQKLNDYIIYEYTKNKMEYSRQHNLKNAISFRLPLQYRRMGNHNKKEDLIPINNKQKINLEDVLIFHNSNLRNSMTKHKIQNFYLKNNIRYKNVKTKPLCIPRKVFPSDEITLKYIIIL